MAGYSDEELVGIERAHPEGVSSELIISLLGSRGIRLTEATLRKYVQLGLLPRSRRVGRKSGSRGSQGLYPATVVRRIQRLRMMMRQYTIEEIKQEFLVVDGGVEELEACLERILAQLDDAARGRRGGAPGEELVEARRLANELVAKITGIEARLAHGGERFAEPSS